MSLHVAAVDLYDPVPHADSVAGQLIGVGED